MQIRIVIVSLVSFAFIVSNSFSQSMSGGIAIRFWDRGCNKGVSGVTVTGTGPQKIRKTRSKPSGDLLIENLTPGKYEIMAVKYGFKRLRLIDIEVRTGDTFRGTFNMEYGFASDDETPSMPKYDPCKQIDKPLKTSMHVGQP